MYNDNIYLTSDEVKTILGVSKSKAYEIIRKLNGELVEKGYFVVAGKVSKKYFMDRYFA